MMFIENLLHGNEWNWRLARTIIQGIVGILIANIDSIIGAISIDPAIKPVIAAAIMAVLSPIMSAFGTNVYESRVSKMAANSTDENKVYG